MDIVERLRRACGYENATPQVRTLQSSASNGLVLDAADEIEQLRRVANTSFKALKTALNGILDNEVAEIVGNAIEEHERGVTDVSEDGQGVTDNG